MNELREGGQKKTINVAKINTILMFNKSRPYIWIIYEKFMAEIKPIMIRTCSAI